MTFNDTTVIGGGVVRSAFAFGLTREGLEDTVLDERDIAIRPSRSNTRVIWVQSKGYGRPEHQMWTRRLRATFGRHW